jgi:uncharacterized protein YndB with AHSA1/START domain
MVQQKSTLRVTAPSDLAIVMTRSFNAPRDLVFDAWTKPEHLVRWFGRRQDTLAVCEIDLRVGGTARFVWRFEDGSEMGITDVYREIAPPERLVFAETFDPPYREEMGGETLNTLVLEERDGKATMTATTLYKSREDRDRALATGMETGAAESFDRLDELLDALTNESSA